MNSLNIYKQIFQNSKTIFNITNKTCNNSISSSNKIIVNYYCTNSNSNNKKNKEYIHNNLFQKGLLTIGSAIVAFINPARGDMVATLGEITGGCAIKSIKEKMIADPVGRQILLDKPRILESTYPANIHLLPETTFGGAYYKWMKEHGYSPDERTQVRMIENEDDAYIMQRYREVHDFWHVLANVRPDFQGEVAIKWFELLQTGLPMTAIGSIIGPLRCSWDERKELINHMIPWAIRSSKNCKFLMNIKYEDHWEDDINEFRKELNFEPYKYLNNNINNTNTNENVIIVDQPQQQ